VEQGKGQNALHYLASALIVGVISVWAVVRQYESEQGEETAFTLLILMGMLIYPWTISNYYVVLLIPNGFPLGEAR
jgi:hypothetical protein